jgi:hypothetical protein
LAMEMREPERRRISLIFVPPRPMMQPLSMEEKEEKGEKKEKREEKGQYRRKQKRRKKNEHHVAGDRDLLLPPVGVVLRSNNRSTETLTLCERLTGLTSTTSSGRRGTVTLLLELALSLLRAGTALSLLLELTLLLRGVAVTSLSAVERTGGTETLRSRVVEDGTLAPLPVVDQALGNLGNGNLDALGLAGNLDDALSRLREHLLRGDHARAGGLLDLTNLGSSLADDGTDEEVGDEETDGSRGGGGDGRGSLAGRGAGSGNGVLEDGLGDEGVGLWERSVNTAWREGRKGEKGRRKRKPPVLASMEGGRDSNAPWRHSQRFHRC